jgi:hypothetical protein
MFTPINVFSYGLFNDVLSKKKKGEAIPVTGREGP